MNRKVLLEMGKTEEEQLLIAKILDKMQIAKTRNKIVMTDFLDSYQQLLIEKILTVTKMENYLFWGGIKEAERKIIIFYPERLLTIFQKEIPNKEEYIHAIKIELPNENKGIYSHREYLGALMKLGIKREKIGDIIVDQDGADIIIIPEIEKYLLYNLAELKRFSKAKIQPITVEQIRKVEIQKEELTIIVSSMRLDTVIAELTKTSRNKASEIIMEERVFINGVRQNRVNKEIKIEDKITIRGKGRFEIKELVRSTKNNRFVLLIEKYK